MKRAAAIILALCMLIAAMTLPCSAKNRVWRNPFFDVTNDKWYFEAVKFANINGIFSGMTPSVFEPDTQMSRAMFVRVLYNLYIKTGVTIEKEQDSGMPFTDVVSGAWYEDAVKWAYERGIVYGVENTYFDLDSGVTREQMCTILYRFAQKASYKLPRNKNVEFTDADEISPYASEAVGVMAGAGVVSGMGQGRLAPKNTATRAQVAQLIRAFISSLGESGVDLGDIDITSLGYIEYPVFFEYDYGVFLSADDKNLSAFDDYETVVIDAQYFSAASIGKLKDAGHTVYSYINIGSLENFRDYYGDFKDITLGEYDNWPGEYWVDVSQKKWQEHIMATARAYIDKGVDGLFADNINVYSEFGTDGIYNGLITIMKYLMTLGVDVTVNGGIDFVTRYMILDKGNPFDILTGINQESVFADIIDFDKDIFGTQSPSNHEAYIAYLSRCAKFGVEIYLLEYTKDDALKKEIVDYCEKAGWYYYISSKVDLGVN